MVLKGILIIEKPLAKAGGRFQAVARRGAPEKNPGAPGPGCGARPITGTRAARAPWIRSGEQPRERNLFKAQKTGQAGGEKHPAGRPDRRFPNKTNKKTPIPFTGELRSAPVLLGPQVGRPPESRGPCPSILQAGLLAFGSSYSRRLPGAILHPSGL